MLGGAGTHSGTPTIQTPVSDRSRFVLKPKPTVGVIVVGSIGVPCVATEILADHSAIPRHQVAALATSVFHISAWRRLVLAVDSVEAQ